MGYLSESICLIAHVFQSIDKHECKYTVSFAPKMCSGFSTTLLMTNIHLAYCLHSFILAILCAR